MEVFRKMSFPQWKFSWPGNFLLLQTSARNYSLYQAKLLGGNGYEARQISKEQKRYQDLCWKVHVRAQSFVFIILSYTMHELRKQDVAMG